MTTETLDAIFEHNSFRLLRRPSVPLREGQRVRLVVEADETPEAILHLAADVYEGLSAQEVAEIEEIALHRGDFFDGPK